MALFEKPRRYTGGEDRLVADHLNQVLEALIRQVNGQRGEIDIHLYRDRLVIGLSPEITRRLRLEDQTLALFSVIKEYDDYLLCARVSQGPDGINVMRDMIKDLPNSVKDEYEKRMPSGMSVKDERPILSLGNPPSIEGLDINSIPDADRVYVAKPIALQRTPFDGYDVDGFDFVYPGVNSSRVWPPVLGHTAGVRTYNGATQKITPPYYVGEPIVARRAYPTGYADPNAINAVADVFNPAKPQIVWQDINEAGRSWAQTVQGARARKTLYADTNVAITGATWVDLTITPTSFTLAEDGWVTGLGQIQYSVGVTGAFAQITFRVVLDGEYVYVGDGGVTNHPGFAYYTIPFYISTILNAGVHTFSIEASVSIGAASFSAGNFNNPLGGGTNNDNTFCILSSDNGDVT